MSFLTYISNLGLKESDSPDFSRKIQLVNQTCLLGTIMAFIFIFGLLIAKNYYYLPIQCSTTVLVSLFYFFNKKRLYMLSMYWVNFFLLLDVFYASIELPNSGTEYLLIPIGFVLFLVADNKKLSIAYCIITFIVCCVSHFIQKTYVPHFITPDFVIQLSYVIVMSSVFTSCAIIIIRFRLNNFQYETIIHEQKLIVETKNKDITDSINYAKRIQQAQLPKKEEINSLFPQSFVLFKPKDIVSGDFYFFHKTSPNVEMGGEQLAFIACADCTGHGVPGAFVSIIGSEKLNDAVLQSSNPSEILQLLNKGMKVSLHQSYSDESTRDGMDIAFCAINLENQIIKYAGANRPIWIIRKGETEIQEIKGTNKAIGGHTDNDQRFATHELKLKQGDRFYIFSDGYADTFDSTNTKKLTTKKFKEILLQIQNIAMLEQEKQLETFIKDWKGKEEQTDDILIIGVEL